MSGAKFYDADKDAYLLHVVCDRLAKQHGPKFSYGILFNDDIGQQTFESLMGTLKAVRKLGIIDFKGQMLLYPVDKDVVIELKVPFDPNFSAWAGKNKDFHDHCFAELAKITAKVNK